MELVNRWVVVIGAVDVKTYWGAQGYRVTSPAEVKFGNDFASHAEVSRHRVLCGIRSGHLRAPPRASAFSNEIREPLRNTKLT